MITIFSIPKPFVGHTDVIQANALQSWIDISDDIILFGNEDGIGLNAWAAGARHVPEVELSKYGTPILSDVFIKAMGLAKYDTLCYVNADIILDESIIRATKAISFPDYVMTGQRHNLDIEMPIETRCDAFKAKVKNESALQNFPGMDYFVFPKHIAKDMLPFIVGRRGWDNWWIYNARKRGYCVIDATKGVLAVHQNHDYNHIPEKKSERWESCPESDYNIKLAGDTILHLWEIDDCNYEYDGIQISPKQMGIRGITQDFSLALPGGLQTLVSPIYRAGHVVKWGYLKLIFGGE
jgi:hypothetical protein